MKWQFILVLIIWESTEQINLFLFATKSSLLIRTPTLLYTVKLQNLLLTFEVTYTYLLTLAFEDSALWDSFCKTPQMSLVST